MPRPDSGGWPPEHEDRLRHALNAEADRVQSDPGALAEIRRRTAKPPFWRSPVVVGLAGATAMAGALVAGAVLVFDRPGDDLTADRGSEPAITSGSGAETGQESGDEDATAAPDTETDTLASPDGGETPSDTPDPAVEPGAGFEGAMPVYYAAPAPSGEFRLTREFRQVNTTESPVKAAVEQMFAERPADPDYVSLWAPADVSSVEVAEDAIVVDLTSTPAVEAPDAGTPAIEMAVQQLVYTVTGAAATLDASDGSLPVRVLVEGERPDDLHAVGLAADLTRASQIEIRQLVQINDPAQDEEVTSPVAVRGEAAVFEAALDWEVRDSSDDVVVADTAMTEVCCEFSEFGFSVDLEPGTYTLQVSDTDPSGGEGGGPVTDTKTIRVVESPASTDAPTDGAPTQAPTAPDGTSPGPDPTSPD